MAETLANGYSSDSTQREISNRYQHDRFWMVVENIGVLVLWTKVALVLERLRDVMLAMKGRELCWSAGTEQTTRKF